MTASAFYWKTCWLELKLDSGDHKQMKQENSSDYHQFSVCTRAGFALPVSAHTQRSRPKTQPILKLTDCEDVKRNIISVLIINQGTIKGFASIHLLVFLCLYLHSKTSCCIKYGHNDVNNSQYAYVNVHMFCTLLAWMYYVTQSFICCKQQGSELLTFAVSRSLQPSFMSIKAIKRLSMWMEISRNYHIMVKYWFISPNSLIHSYFWMNLKILLSLNWTEHTHTHACA